MEDGKLPWWRRALNIALDGIRSGFGLFSKPNKEEFTQEPGTVSAREEAPVEETLRVGHAAAVEPIADVVIAEEPVRIAEAVSEPVAEAAVEPIAQAVSEPVEEVIKEAQVESLPELEGTQVSPEEIVPEHDATLHEEIVEREAGEERSVLSGVQPDFERPELIEGLQAAKAFEPEPFSELEPPAREPETEAEATIETIAVDAPAVDELSMDEAMIGESTVETAPAEQEEEIAVEAETPEEAAPESEADTELEPEVAATEESESPLETEAAEEAGVEVAIEEETTGDAVDLDTPAHGVSAETADADDEVVELAEPEAEIETVPEGDFDEEFALAEESISEVAVSSVELSEPVPAEVAEETPGQPDIVGDEPEEDGPAAPDPVTEIEEPEEPKEPEELAEPVAELAVEYAAEQVAEEDPKPVDIPMELNESIPEQPTEPTEASESVPVEETVKVAEPVATEETAEQTTASEMIAAEAKAELADEAGPTAAATPAAPSKPFIKLESRDNESDLSPFSVVVSQVYDGPLDLLLDLIRKQDIDIYDIPVARITAQFLAYVNQLKATDVDVAGEFIYTASLLIHIKSKMLLPRAPSGQDDAAEDPRRELVERLLEHERFKNAAQMLQQKQMLEAATWTNPGMREFQDDTSAEPEIAADTVDLVRIFRDILERARNRPVINVEEDSVTVGQMIQFLARRLTMEDKPVALRRLLSQTRSERALIAMFLALLELVRLQAILLRQDRLFSEIFIKKHVGFESVMTEGAASVHDDWR